MSAEPTSTASGKSHWCTHCGKPFSRKEHLERHIPSHTNVKPWQCNVCFLGFSRKDLLSRHMSTYHEPKVPGDPSHGDSMNAATSGGTLIACEQCSKAKTGCNKELPDCERCRSKGYVCKPKYASRSAKMAPHKTRASNSSRLQKGQRTPSVPQPAQLAQDHPMLGIDHQLLQSSPHLQSPTSYFGGLGGLHIPHEGDPKADFQQDGAMVARGNTTSGPTDHSFSNPFFPSPQDFPSLQLGTAYQATLQGYPSYFPEPDGMFPLFSFDSQEDALLQSYDATDPSDGSPPSMSMGLAPSPLSPPTRGTSISIGGDSPGQQPHKASAHQSVQLGCDATAAQAPIPEFDDVVEAQASWPLARCTKPLFSDTCPVTALTHLTSLLERSSKEGGAWGTLESYVGEPVNWEDGDVPNVVPLKDYSRDTLLARTQKFLEKALDIHGSSGAKGDYGGYVVLPPSYILHYFLRSCVRSLSVYYPLTVAGCVDPNEMVAESQLSTLLLLLMIAQGAAAMPVAEARYLSTALTETCRISLFNIIQMNVKLSADPVALRCALLFTLLGTWSGDKWLMDMAEGQRGMYMSMLKHAGMLEPQPPPMLDMSGNTFKAQHEAWIGLESRNRVVSNWVMVDHEFSLFHDSAPVLAITALQCPLPAPESLWTMVDDASWAAATQNIYGASSPNINPQLISNNQTQTPSLYDLFQNFFASYQPEGRANWTPQQLRLLLHPIQAMTCHTRQLHSCLPEGAETRIIEIQVLLKQWYALARGFVGRNGQCPLTSCNLVLYHLMYLNTVTNFPEIERLARREGIDDKTPLQHLDLSPVHKRCILKREDAILHCGRVLGLLRKMPGNRRPSWWTAAMYRAVLILWANSVTRMVHQPMSNSAFSPSQPGIFAIDDDAQADETLEACIWQNEGAAVLSLLDGGIVGLDDPPKILRYGIKAVDEAESTRFGDGIRRKLTTLRSNWDFSGLTTWADV